MSELIFILLFFGIPGIFGFIMARKRGKNPYLWGFLCSIIPFFLVVLKMHYKPLGKHQPPA
ncbi:MAG: hypothetical protein M0023_02800 [Desulfobacteraceae bacterium]|nr:hypothetical protein [Desulfobacteraceae bacterium]